MATRIPGAVSNERTGGIHLRATYSSFVADIVVCVGDSCAPLCPREIRASGGDLSLQYRDGTIVTIPEAHLGSPLIDCAVTHIISSGTTATAVTVGW